MKHKGRGSLVALLGSLIQALFLLILYSHFVVGASESKNGNTNLLLVVGDVGVDFARILYEALPTAQDTSGSVRTLEVQVFEEPQHKEAQNSSIQPAHHPKVLHLQDLKEDQEYSVVFGEGRDVASFRTFAKSPSPGQILKLLVVGCNRYFDDRDTSMWEQLLHNDSKRDGMIHTGDQVYADAVAKNAANKTYEQVLEDYRNVYRVTFGEPTMQQVLRRGPHWMLPDDHDFINNFGPDIQIDPKSNLTRAGIRAYDEYQYQLVGDIKEKEVKVAKRIDFVKRIGNTVLVFLDLRMHRTLHFEPEHPMVGTKPLQDFKQRIQEFGNDKSIHHIFVVTSVPLLLWTQTMAEVAFKVEKERYPSHPYFINDTLELLNTMKPHADKIRLVSGDLHQFILAEYCHEDGMCLPQLLSSGMTQGSATVSEVKLLLFYGVGRYYTRTGAGQWHARLHQQVLHKNYGVIEVNMHDGSYDWRGVFPTVIPTLFIVYHWIFDHWMEIQTGGIAILAILCTRKIWECCSKGKKNNNTKEKNKKSSKTQKKNVKAKKVE